jgi:hypothetical protein
LEYGEYKEEVEGLFSQSFWSSSSPALSPHLGDIITEGVMPTRKTTLKIFLSDLNFPPDRYFYYGTIRYRKDKYG